MVAYGSGTTLTSLSNCSGEMWSFGLLPTRLHGKLMLFIGFVDSSPYLPAARRRTVASTSRILSTDSYDNFEFAKLLKYA